MRFTRRIFLPASILACSLFASSALAAANQTHYIRVLIPPGYAIDGDMQFTLNPACPDSEYSVATSSCDGNTCEIGITGPYTNPGCYVSADNGTQVYFMGSLSFKLHSPGNTIKTCSTAYNNTIGLGPGYQRDSGISLYGFGSPGQLKCDDPNLSPHLGNYNLGDIVLAKEQQN